VLHLVLNPYSQALQAKQEREAALSAVALSASAEELATLKKEHDTLTKKCEYLKGVYREQIKNYRTVVYEVTGWKVHNSGAGANGSKWTFESVFAERLEDNLVFEYSSMRVSMLASAFAESPLVAELMKAESFPYMMAGVQLEGYNNQTKF